MYGIREWIVTTPREVIKTLIKGDLAVEKYIGAFRGCDLNLQTHKTLFTGFIRGQYEYGTDIADFLYVIREKDIESIVAMLIDEVNRAKNVDSDIYEHYIRHIVGALTTIMNIAEDDLHKLCMYLIDCATTLWFYSIEKISLSDCTRRLVKLLEKIETVLKEAEVL